MVCVDVPSLRQRGHHGAAQGSGPFREDADIAEAVVEILRDAMLPHPTLAEALNNLFMTLD